MREYILIGRVTISPSAVVEIRQTVILTRNIKSITEYDMSISFEDGEMEEINDLNVDSSRTSCITLIEDKKIFVLGSPLDIFKQIYS